MEIRAAIALASVIGFFGCATYDYNHKHPVDGALSFPLTICPEDAEQSKPYLEAVVRAEGEPGALHFDKSWVCRTEMYSANHAYTGDTDEEREEKQAWESVAETQMRETLEKQFLQHPKKNEEDRPAFGIALSGGGTKAASFAMGVLQGLADEGLLDGADYLSSVSGGGYSAYYYYAHKIFPVLRPDPRRPSSPELFKDCFWRGANVDEDPNLLRRYQKEGYCPENTLRYSVPAEETVSPHFDNRFQAFLRCQQDVFYPGRCTTMIENDDLKGVSPNALELALSVSQMLTGFVANSVFDWGVNVSSSQKTYRHGIGLGFGTTIANSDYLDKANNRQSAPVTCSESADNIFALDCSPPAGGYQDPVPKALTFDELRDAYLRGLPGKDGQLGDDRLQMPFWIINATAPQSRSIVGWFSVGHVDTTNSDMFEMTVAYHGSGRYGYVSAPMSLYNMTALDAVAAAAAFLDASQLAFFNDDWFLRGVAGLTLHLLNLDWGVDIANYNVEDGRRHLHEALPFPLYLADGLYATHFGETSKTEESKDRARSAFIHLIDGGNAENLGVYPLLKRGVRTIVIADSGSDPDGHFDDLCALRKRLSSAPAGMPKWLYIPGLRDFENHCDDYKKTGNGYDLHAWPFELPVLLGCIRSGQQHGPEENACDNLEYDSKAVRLLIAKPAVNLQKLEDQVNHETQKLKDCRFPSEPPLNYSGLLLNCETASYTLAAWNSDKKECPKFPQDSTVTMTVNSSAKLLGAYRELARQYVRGKAAEILKGLQSPMSDVNQSASAEFEHAAHGQYDKDFKEYSKPQCYVLNNPDQRGRNVSNVTSR